MTQEQIYKIYTLSEPNSETIRYVGLTRKSLNERLRKHLSERLRGKNATYKYNWIQSLKNKGLKPIIELIEDNLSLDDANKKEVEYIKIFKSFGAKLTNVSIGGNCGSSGYKHSDELRKFFSNLNLGRKVSDESKKRMSNAQKGKAPWNKGVPMSENAKFNLSASKKGKSSIRKGRTKFDVDLIINLIKEGFSVKEIREKINCSKGVVAKIINNLEDKNIVFELKQKIKENGIKNMSKNKTGIASKNKGKTKHNTVEIKKMFTDGFLVTEISNKLNIPLTSVRRLIKQTK